MTAVLTTRTTTEFYTPSVVHHPFISKDFLNYEPGRNGDVQFKNTIDNENKMHLVNTVNKLTAVISRKEDTEIEASKFQDWIESHGGEQKLKAFVAAAGHSTIIRRKRSTLSNVSYSSDESSDDESDYIPISELKKELAARESKRHQAIKGPKKPSWLTGLLQKKQPGAESPTNRNTISAFFNTKKAAHTEKKRYIPQQTLPARYPYPIERAIQSISYMKLSNPKRPIRQQVLISNLIFQYTTTIRSQAAMLLNKSRKQSVVLSSMTYNQHCTYNIPPRKSSSYAIVR